MSVENSRITYTVLLDEKEVANLICHSVRTIQKWRLTGKGPVYYKLGQSVRYDPDDIDAWLQARRIRHTADAIRRELPR